ncbi:MAG: hypothetical protein ABIJ21_00050 [Nanoarchaeota archaeon]
MAENEGIEGLDELLAGLSKKLVEENGDSVEWESRARIRQRNNDQINRAFGEAIISTHNQITQYSIPYLVLGVINLVEETMQHARAAYEAGISSPIIQERLKKLIQKYTQKGGFAFKEHKIKISFAELGIDPQEVLDRFTKDGLQSVFLYGLERLETYVKKRSKIPYSLFEKVRDMQEERYELLKMRQNNVRLAKEVSLYAQEKELSIDQVVSSVSHMIVPVRKAYGTLEEYYAEVEMKIEVMQGFKDKLELLRTFNLTKKLTEKLAKNHGQMLDDLQLKDGPALERAITIPGTYVHDLAVFCEAFLDEYIKLQEGELTIYKRKGGFL